MPGVYMLKGSAKTELMKPVSATSEEKQLQDLLEANFDLLPGDQIDPKAACRWLLIKREMPVPSPENGCDCWSLDFLFSDQNAIPTLVECKRFNSTESRRQVVGQMLEYAANGHHYWSKAALRKFAEDSAIARGGTLESMWEELGAAEELDFPDSFFDRLEQNLREGRVRIVFFLEKAPRELKSVVEFLSKQVELSEVLLVEARQYALGDTTVIIPTLFGFTEPIRVSPPEPPSTTNWNWATFSADLVKHGVKAASVQQIRRLYDACDALGWTVTWGHGKTIGTFSVKELAVSNEAFLRVYSEGTLEFGLRWFGSDTAQDFREKLIDAIKSASLPLSVDCRERCPNFKHDMWIPRLDALISALTKARTDGEKAEAATA